MTATFAALCLTASLICASELVDLSNSASLMDYAVAGAATAFFAGLTLFFFKD